MSPSENYQIALPDARPMRLHTTLLLLDDDLELKKWLIGSIIIKDSMRNVQNREDLIEELSLCST